jgi:cysteinyl-tRNA synthetase
MRLETQIGKLHFTPLDSKRVTMYVCGPTVWETPHIGNARSAVLFDVLFRLLRYEYGEDHVVFAKNFTDVDDKIIAGAHAFGIPIQELTERTIADYKAAMDALNVLDPTHEPRATMHIDAMSRMIERLVELCVAYVRDSHVLFSVESSQHQTRLLPNVTRIPGKRIAIGDYKDDPRDFVLWKPAKEGEPAYEGPFGIMGRPGWHIECSAMIDETFGGTIDIHGGGNDLLFPHHECEIMQSETISQKPLANYWLHNGMLTVNGQKMSKSANNFITVSETLERVPGEVLRYVLLSGHYRQPLDFTWEKLDEAKEALDRLYRALATVWDADVLDYIPQWPNSVLVGALYDDINTPQAIASLHAYADDVFQEGEDPSLARYRLLEAGSLLGLLRSTPDEWFRSGIDTVEIERLLSVRETSRRSRDFAQADAIREQLRQMGVAIEDTPKGPIWQTI